ncbi:MAG TPA: homoserine kinase [Pyrinomonadaceae bacterium]|nr:homoserine kinase [Pyrinomonadaceae bacterium]
MERPTARMKDEAGGALRNESQTAGVRARAVEVRVPASTSNLGAGFDCFGLALQLYLTIRATVSARSSEACRVRTRGEIQGTTLPRTAENLIFRAMSLAAEREGLTLPPVRLAVYNEIPLGRGLGSSAAAIVGGIKLCAALCGREISTAAVLRYATELEGHADNVAACLLGGWVNTCTGQDSSIIAVKRRWPAEIKIIIVSPHIHLATKQARAALPSLVSHADAVHNLQRTALFGAALEERRYDLLWEAMQDRLHQARRQSLVPGLTEALATPRLRGLLGLALSGAGPSVVALAEDHFDEIGEALALCFRRHGIETTVRLLAFDEAGLQICEHVRRRKTEEQRLLDCQT